MTKPTFEISKTASFDAAHSLAGGSGERPYARLHGHSFQVVATLRGPASGPVGWVADLAELEAALKAIAGALDHSLLNEHPGLESPTLEALCLYFRDRLAPAFPALRRITVSRPTVGETCALEVSGSAGT
jgi:6-pyruvoyltetrahydropterin/6-carboxytetrahydropterin synthase